MSRLYDSSAFSVPEVAGEIATVLPAGWDFEYDRLPEGGFYVGEVRDQDGAVMWSGNSPDERLLLLNCYGWLVLRGQKPKHPAWQRTVQLSPQQVTGSMAAVVSDMPDPGDLDPGQVESVYGGSDE